ncbi:hypothetical protein BJ742DRAFT_840006 [Cladochytrium replicatum]|nr:hypothetical protein BJ742DRAFT_840006 [Cladochytrium replicatum]
MRILLLLVLPFLLASAASAQDVSTAPKLGPDGNILFWFFNQTDLQLRNDLPAGCADVVRTALNTALGHCGYGAVIDASYLGISTISGDLVSTNCPGDCEARIGQFIAQAAPVCGTRELFWQVNCIGCPAPIADGTWTSANNSTEELQSEVLNRATVTGSAYVARAINSLVCRRDAADGTPCFVKHATQILTPLLTTASSSNIINIDGQRAALVSGVANLPVSSVCSACFWDQIGTFEDISKYAVIFNLATAPLAISNNAGLKAKCEAFQSTLSRASTTAAAAPTAVGGTATGTTGATSTPNATVGGSSSSNANLSFSGVLFSATLLLLAVLF